MHSLPPVPLWGVRSRVGTRDRPEENTSFELSQTQSQVCHSHPANGEAVHSRFGDFLFLRGAAFFQWGASFAPLEDSITMGTSVSFLLQVSSIK